MGRRCTQIHGDKVLFCLLIVYRAVGQDGHLATIKSTAARIRALPKPWLRDGERGATPLHTQLKHQLRDWVESRLAGQGKDLAEKSFAATLASELRAAHAIERKPDDPWASPSPSRSI